ncbi:MAG: DUF2520 domain-containing protein [Alistipes senegalensis]|nr:DUF2520 domain-containing protein [Bacteroides cellulosilyticus]MCM1352007.1 DUF2520 domain-containing protein [Alistipes senegalensis]
MKTVVIIGSGNLAESLACAVAGSDAELVQVFARNPRRGPEVARLAGTSWTDDPQRLAAADLYLIAVSDRAVAEVTASLPIPETAVVAHTAGSVPLDAIPARFARRAVFYPLQTFTAGRRVDFSEIPVFLETSTPELRTELEAFARRLTRTVHYAGSAERAFIHLAGVFACNFANAMYTAGERILDKAGLPYPLIKPLIAETAAKACDAATPADVQTGPAVRNDLATQARHCALLADDPELRALYETISRQIWKTSKNR